MIRGANSLLRIKIICKLKIENKKAKKAKKSSILEARFINSRSKKRKRKIISVSFLRK